ncbi:hypothetical protein Cni_G12755 [Canna indica]|uniref:Uncharacterized protein n=1 Tax=Canna indica TaxID=4628 RepID=A0AAQ3QAW6_9LILI|nr:hypothetical protein Cni_G12755 [Canna indica]
MNKEGGQRAPPHGVLLAVVVAVGMLAPFLVTGGGEAVSDAFSNALSPAGLRLLPLVLLLVIRFLSSDRATVVSQIVGSTTQDSIHRVGGSPLGVALLLLTILFLVYYRFSIFGSDDDDCNDRK